MSDKESLLISSPSQSDYREGNELQENLTTKNKFAFFLLMENA